MEATEKQMGIVIGQVGQKDTETFNVLRLSGLKRNEYESFVFDSAVKYLEYTKMWEIEAIQNLLNNINFWYKWVEMWDYRNRKLLLEVYKMNKHLKKGTPIKAHQVGFLEDLQRVHGAKHICENYAFLCEVVSKVYDFFTKSEARRIKRK